MRSALLLLLLVYSTFTTLYAQTRNEQLLDTIKADAQLRSGNFRDILTNFFQFALNDLSGEEKKIHFSTNLFALRLKTNPELNVDTYYKENTFYRNSNVDFDLKLDQDYKFNGMAVGYKYAIINQRDYTIAKSFPIILKANLNRHQQAFDEIQNEISIAYANDPVNLIKINREFDAFTTKNSPLTYEDLSVELQNLIKKAITDQELIQPDWKFGESAMKIYNDLKDSYKKKLLWTIGAQTATYADGFFFSDFDFTTQLSAGLIPTGTKSNLEFDIKGRYLIMDDTLKAGRHLDRKTLSVEAGLNWVFRDHTNDKPFFEYKLATAYKNTTEGLYPDELRNYFTVNNTFRLKVTESVWLPLELVYNPDKEKLAGMISIRLNFD
jgi:hypothetical protein